MPLFRLGARNRGFPSAAQRDVQRGKGLGNLQGNGRSPKCLRRVRDDPIQVVVSCIHPTLHVSFTKVCSFVQNVKTTILIVSPTSARNVS